MDKSPERKKMFESRGLKSRLPKTRGNPNFQNFLESTAIFEKAKKIRNQLASDF